MENRDGSVKGLIFNIQRYSIHDGPGIRTNVFLKGCPLRCKWCCNPESQSPKAEQMQDAEGNPGTVGREVTVGEVMEEIVKDDRYYYRSGGGVTLTGGECLFQPDFSCALLQACRDHQLNTAIETTAFASLEVIRRFIPLVDCWMMDIKHMDPQKHKEWCGQSNEVILDNARYLSEHHPCVILRVPVIPGVNDTPEEIGAIAAFANSLGKGVRALHLLPYHRLGEDKYRRLGRTYALRDIEPLLPEQMIPLRDAAAKYSLPVQIGG
ncbi:MAG: glycyl-radical enzyme activating protein [Clostridia bacterium]|nr:glycyl-radical enzyme activating protein [Clostridia bacterium]